MKKFGMLLILLFLKMDPVNGDSPIDLENSKSLLKILKSICLALFLFLQLLNLKLLNFVKMVLLMLIFMFLNLKQWVNLQGSHFYIKILKISSPLKLELDIVELDSLKTESLLIPSQWMRNVDSKVILGPISKSI